MAADTMKARTFARWRTLGLAAFIALSVARVDAQAVDLGSGTINHDYFTADETPEMQTLLRHVENFHLLNSPHNPGGGGTLGNIRDGKFQYALSDLNYVLERFVN